MSSLLKLVEMGLGGYAVGWINDAYTQPALEGAFPTLQTNHTMAKVVDTGSLGLTTFLGSAALDAVGLQRIAEPVRGGGYIYTVFKGLTVAIPGAEAKLTTPSPLSLFRAALATNPAPAAAAAGSASSPQVTGPPNGQMLLNPGSAPSTNAPASGTGGSQASGYTLNQNGTFAFVPKPASTYLDAGA